MSFLTPWALWIAAIAVPALLVLYFLRLRRREQLIPSTFLWQRAVREMQVNAPFQRLRKNLLLFLQLLVLALAILALARPIVQTALASESSVVLLIDKSASMNTVEEGGRTRLELAKEQATRLVRTLNQSSGRWLALFSPELAGQTRVMVIAFADRAEVVAPFTTDMREAQRLIESIAATDGRTNLREALELAEAYMTQTRIEQTVESVEEASRLVLISDGAVGGLADVTLKAGAIKFLPIGLVQDNVGVTALRAERNYENPELLSVFGQVQNFGDAPVSIDVALYVDGRLETVWDARLDGRPADEGTAGGPAQERRGAVSVVNRQFPLDRAGLVEVRLARKDGLAVDDRALFVAPAPRKLRALLVSEKNFFLEQVLRNLPLEQFDYLTPAQYEAAGDAEVLREGRSAYDVVIFDKQASKRLPPGNYLMIECVPDVAGVEVVGQIGAHAMLWWDDTHPVLRYVGLDYVYAGKGLEVKFPAEAQPLIEGPRGPTLARFLDGGRQFIVLTFAIESSTMWASPSLPVFLYNAVRFLGAGAALGESEPLRPGDPLPVAAAEGAELEITRPDGTKAAVRGGPDGVGHFAGTQRVGLYEVAAGGPNGAAQRFAVNLEDAAESDILPRRELGFGPGVEVVLGEPIETSTPEIWRWFLGAALLIAMVEWYIYNRRVMI